MICLLCLKDIAEVIDIFGKDGVKLNLASVLSKFFWFELKDDNLISTVVCHSCWSIVAEFNEFYLNVEKAHHSLVVEYLSHNNENKTEECKDHFPQIDLCCEYKSDFDINEKKQEIEVCADLEFKDEYLEFIEEEVEYDVECNLVAEELEFLETQSNISSASNENHSSELKIKEMSIKADQSKIIDDLHVPLVNSKNENRNDNIEAEEEYDCKSMDEILDSQCSNNSTFNESNTSEEDKGSKRTKRSKLKKPCLRSTRKRLSEKKPGTNNNNKKNSIAIDVKIANFMHLICDICKQEETTFILLKKHMENVHGCRGYAVCCGKNFYRRIFLAGHIDKHFNPNIFSCKDCGKVFASDGILQRHIIDKHEPEENKKYQCEKCSRKFTWFYLLEQHRCEERLYFCKNCEMTFPTKYKLDTHVKLEHSNNRQICDICAKVFHSKTVFQKHVLEHQGVEIPKVQCEICKRYLKNKQVLNKHKLRHVEKKLHFCDICEKSFRTRYDLSNHKRYVHGNLFTCSICNKTCKTPSYLREHMAAHTGENLYECQHCSEKFRYKTLLSTHRKKNHPKEFEKSQRIPCIFPNEIANKQETTQIQNMNNIAGPETTKKKQNRKLRNT